MVEKLLGLLAQSVGDASWLIVFFACVVGVFAGLLVVAALMAIFGRKAEIKEYAYKVFHDLLGLFRRREDREQEDQP